MMRGIWHVVREIALCKSRRTIVPKFGGVAEEQHELLFSPTTSINFSRLYHRDTML